MRARTYMHVVVAIYRSHCNVPRSTLMKGLPDMYVFASYPLFVAKGLNGSL